MSRRHDLALGGGPFYAEHGFAQHPGMTGMFRVVPARDTAESLSVGVARHG